MPDHTPEHELNPTDPVGNMLDGNQDAAPLFTVTDDRGTVTWTRARSSRGRPAEPDPRDSAAVAGGWLFGPANLVEEVRDILDTAESAEHEVRYGAWTTMPDDRSCATAVLIAMLLALPQGSVGEQIWDYLPTETVPEGAIR